jgi:DNA-binding MarR family transcriptional regulator
LTLTAEGRALIDRGIEARRRWLEDLTTALPPEQQATIVTALVDLTNAARSLDPSLEE